MTVAIVLSGGGSRGSFEIGALEYLYEVGIWGQIICSTSVGSINGAKLAEGGTLQDQRAAFEELKRIWLELQQNEDMYVRAPWPANISPRMRQAIDAMMGLTVTDVLMTVAWPSPLLVAQLIMLGVDLNKFFGEIRNHNVRSLYELTPIQDKLRHRLNTERVKTSGVKLRLTVVSLETGALRYVTEKGELLERDNKTQVPLPPMNITGCGNERQALEALLGERAAASRELHNLDQTGGSKSAAAQEIKRLNKEIAQARKALTECIDQQAASPAARTLDLIDGVLASATMPGYFRPARLDDETYVDGGVREILPIQAALDLEPDHVIAIGASSRGVKRAPSFEQSNFLDVLERSLVQIVFDEITEDEISLAHASGKDVTTIIPNIDMHDSIEVDPGLIRIMMDYGYMRAADVVGVPTWLSGGGSTPIDNIPIAPHPFPIPIPSDTGTISPAQPAVDPETQQRREATADAIALCRWLSWELEHEANGERRHGPRVPSAQALLSVRALKGLIKSLVVARQSVGGRLPPNSKVEGWSSQFETHPWMPYITTPWDHFINRAGEELPAAMIPTALLIKEQSRPEVFLIDGDTKYHVVDEAQLFRLTAAGWAAVNEMPVGVLAGFRHGGPVTWV